MKKSASLLVLLLLLSVVLVSFPQIGVVKAESRTIAVPDDYSTIVDAISNANNGDTILVREGTYEGPINQTVVVDKTLSIVCESTESAIINLYPAYNLTWIFTQPFFSFSDAIAITADACKLLNLTVIISPGGYISATGNQIQITGNNITSGPTTGVTVNGSYCNITDNVMSGRIQLNGSFSEVARNSLSAIYIDGSSNIIKDNVCRHLSLGHFSNHATNNVVAGNRVTTSTRSYSGISLTNSNNNLFYGNSVSGFSSGFRLWFSSGNTITANTISDSLTASISLGGSFNNTIYLNKFVDNMWEWIPYVYDHYTDPNYRQAYPNMTLSINSWDNGKEGNYWGNYNGTDVDSDGIGDIPYIINENNQDNYPLMAPIYLFDAGTWEWTQYNVYVVSNSTVSDFSFNPTDASIRFNVTGTNNVTGYCRVRIPKGLLSSENGWQIIVNGEPFTPTINEDIENTNLYFTYDHSTKTVEIIGTDAIPEFPAWTPLLIMLLAVVAVALIYRRSLHKHDRGRRNQ